MRAYRFLPTVGPGLIFHFSQLELEGRHFAARGPLFYIARVLKARARLKVFAWVRAPPPRVHVWFGFAAPRRTLSNADSDADSDPNARSRRRTARSDSDSDSDSDPATRCTAGARFGFGFGFGRGRAVHRCGDSDSDSNPGPNPNPTGCKN